MTQATTMNAHEGQAQRQELRRQMAIRQRIELRMNSLIERMVTLVDRSTQVAQSDMEKHQMRNLLDMSLDTASVEVIKHYILFQVGRDAAGSTWRKNEFGKKLVAALEELKGDAEDITRGAHKDLRLAEPDTGHFESTWILLARAYLGQLYRYFYYQKEDTR